MLNKKGKKLVPVPKLKKLTSGTGTEINKLTKAFTLVELIVVITILAILATIGFVSFSGYLAGARDVNRITQLKSMSDALELYRTKKDLPLPDNKVEVLASGSVIAYQGDIGKNVLETIEYTESGLDPKYKEYFSYYLTKNKKYFQLMAFLEEESEDVVALNTGHPQGVHPTKNVGVPFMGTLYAGDYSDKFAHTQGKKLGILTDETNTPIQKIEDIKSNGLDIVTATGTYIANIANDEKIEGTGAVLALANPLASCKRIKQLKGGSSDGTYTINPAGTPFKVYCDMIEGGITDFLMGEGNFENGKGIFTENGSNPTNTIVKINSPVNSGYAVHQTNSYISEYEIHFPDISKCKKGYYLYMTLWDADNSGNGFFHHRYYDSLGGEHYILNSSRPIPKILKTQNIEGKEWKLKQVKGKIDHEIVNFNWYIGYNAENPKDLYFTGVRLSCLPY